MIRPAPKITPTQRDSNIEILRLISTFFIIFIHSNFLSLGSPVSDDFFKYPLATWIRTFFESIGIIGVNCFIFISGWFGIKLKIKGLFNLLFQCGYFYIFIALLFYLIGFTDFDISHVKRYLFIDDWFIVSYLLLMILSPVLNTFIEYSTQKSIKNVLILYFVFSFTYGTFSSLSAFNGGYTTIFFVGYYLLIRYIRIYKPSLTTKSIWFDALIYLSISCLLCVLFRYQIPVIGKFTYLNPLIIISSIYFALIFTKFSYKSKIINWFAASAFSIYLLHGVPGVIEPFKQTFQDLYLSSSIIGFWLKDFAIIVCVSIVAILLDQPRKWMFNKVCNWGVVKNILLNEKNF